MNPLNVALLALFVALAGAGAYCDLRFRTIPNGLNALAAVNSLVGIDEVTRVVNVVGFVASAPGFNGQPSVINGASELLAEVFGEHGAHARSAVGVSELPLGAPVEVELIVEVG